MFVQQGQRVPPPKLVSQAQQERKTRENQKAEFYRILSNQNDLKDDETFQKLASELEQSAFELSKGEHTREYRTRVNTIKMRLQSSKKLRQLLNDKILMPKELMSMDMNQVGESFVLEFLKSQNRFLGEIAQNDQRTTPIRPILPNQIRPAVHQISANQQLIDHTEASKLNPIAENLLKPVPPKPIEKNSQNLPQNFNFQEKKKFETPNDHLFKQNEIESLRYSEELKNVQVEQKKESGLILNEQQTQTNQVFEKVQNNDQSFQQMEQNLARLQEMALADDQEDEDEENNDEAEVEFQDNDSNFKSDEQEPHLDDPLNQKQLQEENNDQQLVQSNLIGNDGEYKDDEQENLQYQESQHETDQQEDNQQLGDLYTLQQYQKDQVLQQKEQQVERIQENQFIIQNANQVKGVEEIEQSKEQIQKQFQEQKKSEGFGNLSQEQQQQQDNFKQKSQDKQNSKSVLSPSCNIQKSEQNVSNQQFLEIIKEGDFEEQQHKLDEEVSQIAKQIASRFDQEFANKIIAQNEQFNNSQLRDIEKINHSLISEIKEIKSNYQSMQQQLYQLEHDKNLLLNENQQLKRTIQNNYVIKIEQLKQQIQHEKERKKDEQLAIYYQKIEENNQEKERINQLIYETHSQTQNQMDIIQKYLQSKQSLNQTEQFAENIRSFRNELSKIQPAQILKSTQSQSTLIQANILNYSSVPLQSQQQFQGENRQWNNQIDEDINFPKQQTVYADSGSTQIKQIKEQVIEQQQQVQEEQVIQPSVIMPPTKMQNPINQQNKTEQNKVFAHPKLMQRQQQKSNSKQSSNQQTIQTITNKVLD